uniref:Uncharacterized protein n=1 Tax=Parascaris univalens TaxID=6257 RepID=A0A915B0I4_PARUN
MDASFCRCSLMLLEQAYQRRSILPRVETISTNYMIVYK